MRRRTIPNTMRLGAFVLVSGLWLAGPSPVAGDELFSHVTWTDADGVEHRGVFQGRAEGAAVTGRVYEGRRRLRVTGMLSDGRLSGTLEKDDGTAVGYFLADVDATGRLEGAWLADGNQGTVAARAECLAEVEGRTPPPAACMASDGGAR